MDESNPDSKTISLIDPSFEDPSQLYLFKHDPMEGPTTPPDDPLEAGDVIEQAEPGSEQGTNEEAIKRVSKEDWRYRITEDGRPEAFNPTTGEVAYKDLAYHELKHFETIMLEGQRWWVPVGTPTTVSPRVRFSSLLADLICSYILEGATITDVCQRVGITYTTFCKWRKTNPDFNEAVESAKRDRAEVYFEKMVSIVETTNANKDEVALSRLKTDVYKYMASVGNEAFSPVNKQKIDARIGVAGVETGIRRPGDEGYVEDPAFAAIEEGQRKIRD